MKAPAYDLRRCDLADVEALILAHHGYGSVGRVAAAVYGVWEDGRPVAAYVWQPPPPGAAACVAPGAPHGALALSRMVAVPREERALRHVSRPLRRIMRTELDRGRWPVLVTYSDASMGHTGHVYLCSGWEREETRRRRVFLGPDGERRSPYANGRWQTDRGTYAGHADLTRWVHRACPKGDEAGHMRAAGWLRVPDGDRRWKSGQQAWRVVRADDDGAQLGLFGAAA